MRSVDEILADIDSASTEELVHVANQSGTGEESGAIEDETAAQVADPATSGDANSKAAATPETTATKQTEEQAPIQTRDGKHTIPYEVLANTRAAREAAEAKAKAEADARASAERQLAELKAQVEAAKSGAAETASQTGSIVSEEELAEMEADFPVMAKSMRAMQAELAQLKAASNATEQAASAQSVQDLIDANPKLAHLQASDPKGWQRAVEIDRQLSGNPDFAGVPLADRFAKAAAAYEAMYGAINLPATAKGPAPKIEEVLAAANKTAAPHSLSDMHGGTAVASNELEGIANQSAAEIGAKFASMNPKQLEAYLNGIGS